MKRYEIRAPEEVVVLCTKQYHQDMLRLYFPEIRSVVAKPKILRYVLDDIEVDEWKVHMCFPGKYFARFEASVNSVAMNYLEWMSKWFKLQVCPPVKPNEKEFNKAFNSAINKLSLEQKNALMIRQKRDLLSLPWILFRALVLVISLKKQYFQMSRQDMRYLKIPQNFLIRRYLR